MKLCLLLFLSFQLANAVVKIRVITGQSGDAIVRYSGVNFKVITRWENELFGLTDWSLRNMVKNYYNKAPDHLYTPTRWGNLNQKYCWEPIMLVSWVKNAMVVNQNSSPDVLQTEDFDNLSDKPIKVSAALTQTVERSLSVTFTENEQYGASASLSLEVSTFFTKAKGGASVSYKYENGHAETTSKSVTIGSTRGIEFNIDPGKSMRAELTANKGEIEVEVQYEAALRGILGVSFEDTSHGHYYWGLPIDKLIGHTKSFTQRLKLGFYTAAHTRVYDVSSNKTIGEIA